MEDQVVEAEMETEDEQFKRKAEEPVSTASEAEEPGSVTWQPTGSSDALKWKRQKASDEKADTLSAPRVLTDQIRKKMLDKEIPFKSISPKDMPCMKRPNEKSGKIG